MLSLLFFFAIFAGCRHISQFNLSLKKAYWKATRSRKKMIKGEEIDSTHVDEEVEMAPINSKELEKEFMEYFSFGRYLELH